MEYNNGFNDKKNLFDLRFKNNNEKLVEVEKYGKINTTKEEYIESYEVLTDGYQLWISSDNLVKICKGFSAEQLSNFYFKPDDKVVQNENYIVVKENFLEFIKNNTRNPKYVPILSLLKLKERENDVLNNTYPDYLVSQTIGIDGKTEEEFEQVTRTR